VVAEITANGGRAVAFPADISKPSEVKALFEEAKRQCGTVDIVVNNAAVFKPVPLADFSEEAFHWHFNTNVMGGFLCARESLAYFPEEGGSIINVTSILSQQPVTPFSLYNATKGAVDTMTRALAKELAPRKIRVNAIAPGATDTEGVRALGTVTNDAAAHIVAQTPLGRVGQPDDIARVAVFLASEDAAWLTGEIITASGGYH
jgi:3-oxoacyl-[acyl-carrier protein] reductase